MRVPKGPLANSRGIVLVISLMILALILGAGVGAILSVQMDLRSSGNFEKGTQAFYIAEAGVNHARQELQDADGILDFDSVYAAANETVIVAVSAFNGGTYSVKRTGFSINPTRIKVLAVATLPNGVQSQIEVWFKKDDGRPPKAIETNGTMQIDGDIVLGGTCGGAHANGTLAVDAGNNPGIQMVRGLTSSQGMDISGSPCIGSILCLTTPPVDLVLDTSDERNSYEATNQNSSTYSIPPVQPKDYAPKVAALGDADKGYILHNDGTVTTGGSCDSNGLCSGGTSVAVPAGWSYSGDTWKVTGSSAATGIFYSESDVEISGSPGSLLFPWQTTIISRKEIEVSGSPHIMPYPTTVDELKNHLFVAGDDLKISGDMKASYANGAILVGDDLEIDGDPVIKGFILVRDDTEVNGDPQITYACDFGCKGPACPVPLINVGSLAER